MMRTIRFILLFCCSIFSLTSVGEVWKGVNLNFLTNAHEDFVKSYPCVVMIKNYEATNSFGEISKGKVVKDEVVSYDKHGYIDKEGSTIYENEYSNGRIIKRTGRVGGTVSKVIKYSYEPEGVSVIVYNASGDQESAAIFLVDKGVLIKGETTGSGKSYTKYNSSGFPIENFVESFVSVETTMTYKNGLLSTETLKGVGKTRVISFSNYETNNKGEWTSRVEMTNDYDGNIRGGLMANTPISTSNELQTRTFINKDEYEAELQREAEENQKRQEEALRIQQEKSRQEAERRLIEAKNAELASIADYMNGMNFPPDILKQYPEITLDFTPAIQEIWNLRKTAVTPIPLEMTISASIGESMDVTYLQGESPDAEFDLIADRIKKSEFCPAIIHLEKLDSTLVIPRKFKLTFNESGSEQIISNPKIKTGLHPIEIKAKKDKKTGVWSITNLDKVEKAGYNVDEVTENALKYINSIQPQKNNINLTLYSYKKQNLTILSKPDQTQTRVIIPKTTYEMPSIYRFKIKE